MRFLPGLFESKGVAPSGGSTARAIGTPYLRSVPSSIGSQWDVQTTVTQHYERVLFVFRCVDVISSNQAKAYMLVKDGENIVPHDDVERLLNHRANNYETATQFRYRLSSQLLLSSKGAFVEVVKSRSGGWSELHLLPPHQVEPIPDADNFVAGYRINTMGRGVEVLEPHRVIWLRNKPHPLDPYKQMTPMVASSLASETDYLARLFNRNFLLNDGRPGMLINIRGQMDRQDMEEIKRRFGGGPVGAGQTSVIDGAEGIDAQDFSGSPRDASWMEAVNMSKQDIMLAFGVPESVMGNASGRTYDNADAERSIFWEETMQPHMDAIARGLDALTHNLHDRTRVTYDYDKIPDLQRVKEARRLAKADEVSQGLATIDDYFEHIGKAPWNVPATSILVNKVNVPIGANKEDQEAVDKMRPWGMPAQPGEGGAMPGMPGAQGPGLPSPNGSPTWGPKPTRDTAQVVGWGGKDLEGPSQPETKDLGSPTPPDDAVALQAHLEGLIDGALDLWAEQQADAIGERLFHAKARKGTRHWDYTDNDPQPDELKALPPLYVVRPYDWRDRVSGTLKRKMTTLARKEANRAARDLLAAGARPQTSSNSPVVRLMGLFQSSNAISKALLPTLGMINAAVDRKTSQIVDQIQQLDAQGASLTQIKNETRTLMRRDSSWREHLAQNAARAVVEGVRANVHEEAFRNGTMLTKTWRAMHDGKTRHDHANADGQVRAPLEPFSVGGYSMRYPGDPTAPMDQVINCRCEVHWSKA